MSELVVALAGGAIGSVLTTLARYSAVPAEVRQHDRQIAEIDADLDRFAADEYARLRNAVLPQFLNPDAKQRMTFQQQPGKQPQMRAKEWIVVVAASIQLYRDHENAQIGRYREIVASENLAHRIWRMTESKLVPQLQTPPVAARFIDRWWTLRTSTAERAHMPDPRQRSIAAATKSLDKERAEIEQEREGGDGAS